MAATFPGGVKQFPVINPGDPILSSTENAQQEEIVAIETELRKSSGSVIHHGALAGLSDNDHPQYVLAADNKIYFAMSNTTWNFKPGGTDLFVVDSMSLSNVVIPAGHNLLVEFDAIGYFRDTYGANIYLYNGPTLMITFGAPMRMNIATARAGFHYSYRITSAGTYNLSIRCTANGSTTVDMDFSTRSLKATVIQE